MKPIAPAAAASPANAIDPAKNRDERAALRKLSHDLESVFVKQLFAAMRSSVPKEGIVSEAPGADMFNQLLDDKLATETSARMSHGIADALYRQLSRGLPPAAKTEEP
jgi:flagellar protein FlgJ